MAALTALSLSGASLMPEKGKISIHGADGASFRKQGELMLLKQEKPGVQHFLRGLLRFKEPLDGSFAANDALVLVMKTDQDLSLRTRWRKTDKRLCHTPDVMIKAGKEFQEVVVPLPNTRGKQLMSLELHFTPNPGSVEIRKIAIEKPRKITLFTEGDPVKAQNELFFKGTTDTPDADVTICIRNSRGEVKTKKVKSKNGRFELKWKRPPINIGLWNTAYAQTGTAGAPSETSIPLRIFGYRADDSHAWTELELSVLHSDPPDLHILEHLLALREVVLLT